MKIWEVFPRLTERIWQDHAEAGMLGGHHDPDHAVRVGQMAMEIAEDEHVGLLACAAGLCHNAGRILQKRLGIGRRDVPKDQIRKFVQAWLNEEYFFLVGEAPPGSAHEDMEIWSKNNRVIDAVLKHDGENSDDDDPVLVTLMDADRLVNAEPDLIIRSAQLYHDLPAIDPINFGQDPQATYRDPRSVLRDVMETIVWLTPGTDFYVRLPKAREIAAERKAFFDDFAAQLLKCRAATGFYPYPPELIALREKFAAAATTK